MTLGRILNQMGIGPKLTERFASTYGHDYGGGGAGAGGAQDSHMLYQEPVHTSHVHHHVASSKHHHHHGGDGGHHKSKAAMSALTLLAFLFFLHILQQCLKEHMNSMTTPQVVVVTGGRDGEDPIAKSAIAQAQPKGPDSDENNSDSKFKSSFTKISTTVHTPQNAIGQNKYRKGFVNSDRNAFPGFVSAMDD